jgi:hypothetical protein
MNIQHFFDPRTSSLTYVVHDEASRIGVVIDSVMDFDPKSGRTWQESCDAVSAYIDSNDIKDPVCPRYPCPS